jgi:hypothetical protein
MRDSLGASWGAAISSSRAPWPKVRKRDSNGLRALSYLGPALVPNQRS